MNEEEHIIISNICRVCLHEDVTKYLSLFELYNDSRIADKINSIATVDICEGDGFPARICPDCLIELENAIIFKLKCEKSNSILRKTEVLDKNEDEQMLVEVKEEEDLEYKSEPESIKDQMDDHPEDELREDDNDHKEDDSRTDLQIPQLISEIEFEKEVNKSRAIDLKLECHDCGGFFKSKCKLQVHWKTAHKPKLICEICKRVFVSYKAYHLHIKEKKKTCLNAAKVHIVGEGKTRIFHCKECDYKASTMYQMNSHLVTHSGERPYQCDKCTSSFTQISSLQGHKEMLHKEFKVEITCQYCGKFLQGRSRVYQHMLTHKPKSVQCDVCKKFLSSKNILKDHMRRHTGVRPYTCEICGSTFHSLAEVSTHKRRHSKNKNNKCDICGYTARRKDTIKKHKSKHTSTNSPCLICGTFAENTKDLALHMKRHLERPYACPFCDLTFHKRNPRSRHVVKKHKCTMLDNCQTKIPNRKK